VAVDNSSAMVTRFRDRLQQENLSGKITVLEEDLLKTQIQEASVVVMNFTLQFIPLDQRKELLTRIAQGLRSAAQYSQLSGLASFLLVLEIVQKMQLLVA